MSNPTCPDCEAVMEEETTEKKFVSANGWIDESTVMEYRCPDCGLVKDPSDPELRK